MFNKKTINDIDVKDKVALVRADFNVPLNNDGVITDDYRIVQSLPTIEHLRSLGAKVVLISHLGRPSGANDKKNSLAPVAIRLSDLLHLPVKFVDDCMGTKPKEAVDKMNSGDIVLLENLRFYQQEEANDDDFAKELANLADIFVQDGFGVVHRSHSSTVAITKFLPSVAGCLLAKEASTITGAIENPERPLGVVIGGAKISDKIDLLNRFIEKADYIAIVGAMANTFLLAEGIAIGKSIAEKDAIDTAKDILEKANRRMQAEHFTFYLPHDVVVANSIDNRSRTRVVDILNHTWADIINYPLKPKKEDYSVAKDELILDIGPMSAACIAGSLKLAKTVIWNGTAGVTEIKGLHGAANPFSHGTDIIAESLVGENAGDSNKPFAVVGGGDTVGYVESIDGLKERLGHVSTGGGASLELIAGYKLPGIEALLNK